MRVQAYREVFWIVILLVIHLPYTYRLHVHARLLAPIFFNILSKRVVAIAFVLILLFWLCCLYIVECYVLYVAEE
jgi:hypothetical protein